MNSHQRRILKRKKEIDRALLKYLLRKWKNAQDALANKIDNDIIYLMMDGEIT